MNRLTMILAVVILPAWVLPAPADGLFGLFGKKAKADPAVRVPELVATLKSEQDERKRASAAAELGTYDAAAFSEIVPILVDVLQHDPKPSVRMDAASSLGNMRPVSQLAGDALDKAVTSDDNWRVRLHAKGILMKYRFAGYSPGSKTTPAGQNGPKTTEPPLLEPNAVLKQPNMQSAPAPAQFPTGPNTMVTASPAKFTAPKKEDALEFRPSVPRPLPPGPTFTMAVPQQTIEPAPVALPMVDADGPPLTPPPSTPTQRPTPPAPEIVSPF